MENIDFKSINKFILILLLTNFMKSLEINTSSHLLKQADTLCREIKHLMWDASRFQNKEQFNRVEKIYEKAVERYIRRWQLYQQLTQDK